MYLPSVFHQHRMILYVSLIAMLFQFISERERERETDRQTHRERENLLLIYEEKQLPCIREYTILQEKQLPCIREYTILRVFYSISVDLVNEARCLSERVGSTLRRSRRGIKQESTWYKVGGERSRVVRTRGRYYLTRIK